MKRHRERIEVRARIRWLIVVGASLAIALLVPLVAVAVGHLSAEGSAEEARAQAVLSQEFEGTCVTAQRAVSDLSSRLTSEGLAEWSVLTRAQPSDCVAGGLVPASSTIVLFRVESPAVTAVVSGLRDDLMARCLDRDQAIALTTSTLQTAGLATFEVRTDGPFAFPLDQEAAVRDHIAEGCYVYSLSGHDAQGTPVYYLSGAM
jgi:hypothetical protein